MKWHVPSAIHPPVPSAVQLAQKFFIGEIVGRPWVVNIEVTQRCNARCDFCNHRHGEKSNELVDYRLVVERFRPLAVTLTGGEPLLRMDLPALVTSIKGAGPVYLALLTNGSLLTLERAAALRARGLDALSISLNFPGPGQDAERGIPGLFDHLCTVVPQLPGLGFHRIDLNTVIMEENLQALTAIVVLAKQWGVRVSFSCYSPAKTGVSTHRLRDRGSLPQVLDQLQWMKARGWPISSSAWYLQQISQVHVFEEIPGCRAGQRTIHVTPDGMVKPCPDLPPVAHFTRYTTRNAQPVSCACCWYRCRGEVEAPLLSTQIFEYLRYHRAFSGRQAHQRMSPNRAQWNRGKVWDKTPSLRLGA